jgi:hypothetical protein
MSSGGQGLRVAHYRSSRALLFVTPPRRGAGGGDITGGGSPPGLQVVPDGPADVAGAHSARSSWVGLPPHNKFGCAC